MKIRRRVDFLNDDEGKRLRFQCGADYPQLSSPKEWCPFSGVF